MRESDMTNYLQWTAQPAFWVTDGIIRTVNLAASSFLLREDTPVSQLLKTGHEEYTSMEQGILHLSVEIGEQEWNACVHRMEHGDLFVLESTQPPQLRAMSLAAMKLREPVAALMTELDQLLPEVVGSDPDASRQAGRINRRLHQLLRMIGNMSAGNGGDACSMELREICGVLDEIFEKAETLTQARGVKLDWSVPNDRIYTVADMNRVERAVYNMLSNALKATPAGGTVYARVLHRGKRLLISVTDTGDGIPEELRSSVYTRYLREPGLESPDMGIGLGMNLIVSTARLHGGTVLLETPPQGGTRVTMTLAVSQEWGGLRSSSLPVDYTGGQDHAMVELSDILPSSVYEC